MILTLVVGGLVVLTSYLLDPVLTYLQRKYHIKEYERLEWNTNGILQLQRLAHEGLGSGVVVTTRTRTRTISNNKNSGGHPSSPGAETDTSTLEVETEEVKEGWIGAEDLVPVTPGRGMKLACLDVSDRRHPRLKVVDRRTGGPIMEAGLHGFDRRETLRSPDDGQRKAGVVTVENVGQGGGDGGVDGGAGENEKKK